MTEFSTPPASKTLSVVVKAIREGFISLLRQVNRSPCEAAHERHNLCQAALRSGEHIEAFEAHQGVEHGNSLIDRFRRFQRGLAVMLAGHLALTKPVSGAIGYFIGLGIWLFGLAVLRRAQRVEQVRTLTQLVRRTGPFFGISILLILATGLYMTATAWGFQTGWIDVALISLILIAPLGTDFIEPRRRTIDRLAKEAPDAALPRSLEQSTRDPVLLTAVETVTILLRGIVFLMTNKPSLIGSLMVMAIALALGLALGALTSRAAQTREQNLTEPTRYITQKAWRLHQCSRNQLFDQRRAPKRAVRGDLQCAAWIWFAQA